MLIYNIGIILLGLVLRISSLFGLKARLWCRGRSNWRANLAQAIPDSSKVVWIHAASLGEFEQGRPVIEKIREQYPSYFILLTFFSPSGYQMRKDYKGADYVCYLPLDTTRNVRNFVSIVKPEIAIFVKYEFWINLLTAAFNNGCRLFVISSIFRKDSVFFKWYGGAFRRLLKKFECIFVQDSASVELLKGINITNTQIAGDTRFDRVAAIAKNVQPLPLVESFAAGSKVLVCGSTWPADEALLLQLIEKHKDVKFIIAPHQIEPKSIECFREKLTCSSVRYTQCEAGDDLSRNKVLFVDTIGILSSVYNYGSWAYIGGGFGVGIHNTLEAATFALPLCFGVNYHKFAEARELVSLGAACSVENFEQLDQWFDKVKNDAQLDAQIRRKLKDYVGRNVGATKAIITRIFALK